MLSDQNTHFGSRYAKAPSFPLDTSTDGGCDAPAKEGGPWTRQIETLWIDESRDYLIAADLPGKAMAGQQELWNVMKKEGLKNLIYMGVHENMCIMGRPFAIENVAGWGMGKDNVAVMRELVDGERPMRSQHLELARPAKQENNGGKMGEVRPKTCKGVGITWARCGSLAAARLLSAFPRQA